MCIRDSSEIERYSLRPGDLLFARQSLVLEGAGKCSIVLVTPEITTFESHLIRVRLNEDVADPEFYFNYFRSHYGKASIASIVMQVAAAGIRGSELATLSVPSVPLYTQKHIACILSAYDDLIDNNTRRIKILEEMAKMIYREWFVNLRFPGHEKVKMIESELGLIPEGFKVEELGSVVVFENGKATEIGKQGPFPLYGSNGVVGGSTVARYQNGVIIGRVGAYCGSTMYCGGGFWASDNTIVAKPVREKNLCVEFVYFLLQGMNLRRYAGGAAQPLLTQNVLRRLRCVVPDEKVNSRFHDIFNPILTLTSNLRTQVDNLRRTRDLILPKVFSGEASIEQPEAEVVAQGV